MQTECKMRTADFTLSLHFTPGPQSAVRSPQSSFYTDLFERCYRFNWPFGGCIGSWETGSKFVPSKKFKLQLDAASSQAPVEM